VHAILRSALNLFFLKFRTILKKNGVSIPVVLAVALLFLTGCSSTRWLKQPGYLVNHNTITVNDKKVEVSELENYLEQKPNKRLLGLFRVSSWIYAKTGEGKPRKAKVWFRRRFGKPPVMLDNNLTDNACRDMRIYLHNIGYFNATVTPEYIYRKNKVNIHYMVVAGRPYIIRDTSWIIPDDTLRRYVVSGLTGSLIRPGDPFNAYTLDSERDRITRQLKNLGYYDFVKDYISYDVDTTLSDYRLDIAAHIANVRTLSPLYPDSVIEVNHKRFILNNIYVNPDVNVQLPAGAHYDTLQYMLHLGHHDSLSGYYFLHHGPFSTRPKVYVQSIFFKKGDLYHQDDVTETSNGLSRLPVTRLATINFDNHASPFLGSDYGMLDCRINIARPPINSFSIETDVTNSAGNPGLAANLSFQNKNIFRGAELFRIQLHAAAESQSSAQKVTKYLGVFNTLTGGLELSLQFPRFLAPISQDRFPKYFKPRTSIINSYFYERWPYYERYLSNLTYGYDWDPTPHTHHSLYPFELSSVSINVFDSTEFYKVIYGGHDLRLIEQYTDHIIFGMLYKFIYSTQQFKKPVNFIFLELDGESSGNILYAFTGLAGTHKNPEDKYIVLGIPFAQYLKGTSDFRYYNYLNEKNVIIYRGYVGLGWPYGNSRALPFERAFYGGGANDMRGYTYLLLGPGSYHNDTIKNIYRMGDIKLMGNVEYRFPIYKFIHGALFTDAGNIWLAHESETFPGGVFQFDTFLRQVAIDVGIGLRLDFDFFIFRVDVASPFHDPARKPGERWLFTNGNVWNLVWNFAIGYPF